MPNKPRPQSGKVLNVRLVQDQVLARGWSNDEFAAACNISTSYACNILKGHRSLSAWSTVPQSIAAALKLPVDAIMMDPTTERRSA